MMAPFVEAAPRVRAATLRLANPRTRNGIRLLHAAAGVAASPSAKAIGSVAGRALGNTGANHLALPDYGPVH